MTPRLNDIWVYLSTTPLLGLTVTLLVYQGAYWVYKRANFNPLLNPVPWSVAILMVILTVTNTPYQTYFDGAQFVHFLLGPATVALAVPLYPQLGKLRRFIIPVIGALLVGGTVAAGSAVGIAWLLGASDTTLRSIAPKSVTAPIAMGISEKIGGLPSLTAVLVMVTGVVGVINKRQEELHAPPTRYNFANTRSNAQHPSSNRHQPPARQARRPLQKRRWIFRDRTSVV